MKTTWGIHELTLGDLRLLANKASSSGDVALWQRIYDLEVLNDSRPRQITLQLMVVSLIYVTISQGAALQAVADQL
jgi:hypothetical protein